MTPRWLLMSSFLFVCGLSIGYRQGYSGGAICKVADTGSLWYCSAGKWVTVEDRPTTIERVVQTSGESNLLYIDTARMDRIKISEELAKWDCTVRLKPTSEDWCLIVKLIDNSPGVTK